MMATLVTQKSSQEPHYLLDCKAPGLHVGQTGFAAQNTVMLSSALLGWSFCFIFLVSHPSSYSTS